MSRRLATAGVATALALLSAAGTASAQQLSVDPSSPRQGTTLLLAVDESVLSAGGQPAGSITIALARGMRVDTTARERLCRRREAARAACPDSSRIGFGRFSLSLEGYEASGGESELAWALDAYLGEPVRRGDAGSVVLIGNLLGADLVETLLAPKLGASIPRTTTTVGRLIRRRSGSYGVELKFDALPARLGLAPPMAASPSQLELALGAVRRVRQNFTRRIRIRTPSGYEVRKIRDHRLNGHHLFSTPSSCQGGSWRGQLRVGGAGGVRRLSRPVSCTEDAIGVPAAVGARP